MVAEIAFYALGISGRIEIKNEIYRVVKLAVFVEARTIYKDI